MHLLKDDESIKLPVHNNRNRFDNCDMCTQVGDESMLPDFPADTYLFCNEVSVGQLEPGKVYVFCMPPHPHYRHIFKQFDGITDAAIQVSATNPAYNPCEPIPLADLICAWAIEWHFTKKFRTNNHNPRPLRRGFHNYHYEPGQQEP